MAEVRREWKTFRERHCQVVIITLVPSDQLKSLRHEQDLPFPVLGDPARARTARQYGIGRASPLKVFAPQVLKYYWRAWRLGTALKRPQADEDVLQLGGSFLIDHHGRVRLAHYS